ncbi:MAG: MASE3 domain-containing protein, partial [Candidatus Helarchaeota archaeon]
MNKSKIRIFSLRNVIYILILSIIISALVYSSTYNYLLFHTIVELVTILIGFGVFIFAWNSRQFSDSNFITFIGISFLSISSIDLLHTLAYKGMHIFQGYDSNLPTQLWIAARFLQSISFLIALLYLRRKLKPYLIVLGYFLVTVLLVSSIFLSIFPDCYIEGSGLTDFKITSEYLISLIFIIATVLIIKNRKEFDNKVFIWIVVSLILMIGGEIAFTFY